MGSPVPPPPTPCSLMPIAPPVGSWVGQLGGVVGWGRRYGPIWRLRAPSWVVGWGRRYGPIWRIGSGSFSFSNLMACRAGFTFIIPTDPSHEKSASAGLHFSCNWALELSGSFSEKEKRRTSSPALAVSTLATSQALCRVTKRSRALFFCWIFFVAGRYMTEPG
jgi:hypothetical protein